MIAMVGMPLSPPDDSIGKHPDVGTDFMTALLTLKTALVTSKDLQTYANLYRDYCPFRTWVNPSQEYFC
jgi:hypothetical protein